MKRWFIAVATLTLGGSFAAQSQTDIVYSFTNFVGLPGSGGSADGTNTGARFGRVCGVAVDSVGNVFIADYDNSTIRRATAGGVVTTLAGSAGLTGSADGTNSTARFNYPGDVAVDGGGNVFVADTGNQTIRKITPAGAVSTVAGSAGLTGSTDGTNGTARFNSPWAIAVDGMGNIFVADYYNHTIRKVEADGAVTTLIGSPGVAGDTDGTNDAVRLSYPSGVAVNGAGTLFVQDLKGLRQVTPVSSNWVAKMILPGVNRRAVAVDGSNNLFITARTNQRILKATLSGATWTATAIGGGSSQQGSTDGIGSAARFSSPWGIAVNGAGMVYIGDFNNNRVSQGEPLPATRLIGLAGDMAFGPITLTQSGVRTLTITNSGNAELTVTGLVCPPAFSGHWSGLVPPGTSANVDLTFGPMDTNPFGGIVTVLSDATSGTNSIQVSGTGILPVCTGAAGTTIRVPADQPTIQAAMNIASTCDTILVEPGTYFENLNFLGKNITVRSSAGAASTIVDGGNLSSVVVLTNGEPLSATLQGFTLRRGNASFGGGIRIEQSAGCILDNLIWSNQATSFGCGIQLYRASAVVAGNVISNNSGVDSWGGGISVMNGAQTMILRNQIVANSAGPGGGALYLNTAGTVFILGNRIGSNIATGVHTAPGSSGGAILVQNSSTPLIQHNLIDHNFAWRGAGIAWSVPDGGRGPYVINNTFVDNNASSSNGSAIYSDYFAGSARILNNIIVAPTGQTAIVCSGYASPGVISNNDVVAPGGQRYTGNCADLTGVNGNISADPLFVNRSALDYHLLASSPCVDAGTNSLTDLLPEDSDGNPRIVDGNNDGAAVVDIGAYEVIPVVASFTASPTQGTAPLLVTFTDTSRGGITNRSWTFGDGGMTDTMLLTVSHTYNVAGTNTVTLIVRGAAGVSTNIQINLIVVKPVDSVGDGIADAWRQAYFAGSGTTTNELSCATCDADGTGQNNLFKYLAGLNPTNPASIFRILSTTRQSNDVFIVWQTAGGRTNVVQVSPLLTGDYTNVSPSIIIPGSGDVTTNYFDVGGATNGVSRFYRVRLVP